MRDSLIGPPSSDWPTVHLGEIATLINGRAYAQHELLNSGTPVLRIQNLNGGDRWYYSDLELPSDKYCEAGDLLYAWSASFGPYIWDGPKSIFHYHIWKVIPSPRLDRNFAYYLLGFITETLKQRARGIAMLHLTKSGVEAWPVAIPPLAEQRRVAAILDAADALRQKRRQALRLLDQLTQAIFVEMFGEWDRPGSNVRTFELGSKIDFLTSGSRGWAEHYADEGALFLRIQNVCRDDLDLSDVAFVNAPDTAEAKRTRVQPGDVLLSITADLGRTAVVPEDIGEAYINQHLAIIRASKIEPHFLSAALTSPAGQRAILRRNREGVKAGLNFDDVRSVRLPDVPIEEQRIFARRAKQADALKGPYQCAAARLDSLFQSLQHRAFRGEL